MKVCSKCGENKREDNFPTYKNKNGDTRLRPECKLCRNKALKDWRKRNPEYKREYRLKNGDKIREKENKRREANKEAVNKRRKAWRSIPAVRERELQYKKEYRKKNKDTIKRYRDRTKKEYNAHRLKNKDRIAKKQKEYVLKNKDRINKVRRELMKNNPEVRIAKNARGRIRMAIKNQSSVKACKSLDLLGCSAKKARKHIESQFTKGMSWDNYGLKGWHIDHIRPCASFDLTKPEEQKKCFHYTNLQPLWAEDNLKKGVQYNG